jgi:hypothetical protein
MGIPDFKVVCGSLRSARARSNGNDANARTSPQTIGAAPHLRPRMRPGRRDPALAVEIGRRDRPSSASLHSALNPYIVIAMPTDRPEPNAELHESFEPLRTTFALLALLLGLVAAMHF